MRTRIFQTFHIPIPLVVKLFLRCIWRGRPGPTPTNARKILKQVPYVIPINQELRVPIPRDQSGCRIHKRGHGIIVKRSVMDTDDGHLILRGFFLHSFLMPLLPSPPARLVLSRRSIKGLVKTLGARHRHLRCYYLTTLCRASLTVTQMMQYRCSSAQSCSYHKISRDLRQFTRPTEWKRTPQTKYGALFPFTSVGPIHEAL